MWNEQLSVGKYKLVLSAEEELRAEREREQRLLEVPASTVPLRDY
jgi:hypothetical protein